MGTIKEDLAQPGIDLVETHISWVFLAMNEVWKVKKPVSLGFLDFSTPDRRRRACEAEIRLNRRLAPDVYLGVVPVTRGQDGVHELDGAGPTVDWAVHMTRLADADRADVRLGMGTLEARHLERLAERLASFHAAAKSDEETARCGAIAAIEANVAQNFEQTRDMVSAYLTPAEATEIEAWQRRFLAEHGARFQDRIRANRIREGHGDLRLEHIHFNDSLEPTIRDCIEFDATGRGRPDVRTACGDRWVVSFSRHARGSSIVCARPGGCRFTSSNAGRVPTSVERVWNNAGRGQR